MEYNSNNKYNNYKIEEFQKKQLEQLSSLFNKLYHSLNRNCPNNYSLPKNFQNLLLRILSSNLNVMKKDESVIINSLLDKVNKISNYDKDAINRFQYLYSKLAKNTTIKKRWGLLYLMNSLSQDKFKNIDFKGTNQLQRNYLKASDNILDNVNCIQFLLNDSNENTHYKHPYDYNHNENEPNNNIYDSNNTDCNIDCSQKCKNYLNNLSPVTDVNEKFCENENLIMCNNRFNDATQPHNGNSKGSFSIVVDPKKTNLKITEKDIINDLLFVFEGINGKYIAYDASKDAFILNPIMPWSEELYNIVNSLCELGWLYRRIKLYIDYFKSSSVKSQFIQSFIYAIQKELDNHFRLISFFKKINNNQKTGNEIGKRNLNLKNLFLWTLDQKEKLKWIAASCETIHPLKGPPVLSQIYSIVNYGGCNRYLNDVLNEVSKPLISFILNWIKYGKLEDPYKEFFVEIIKGIGVDDIWKLMYQIVGKNVPNFMKRSATIKIFEVGKCIHFIRNFCKENYNLSNLKKILINLIEGNEKRENDENIENKVKDGIASNNFGNNNFDYGYDKDKIKFEIESLKSCLAFIDYLFSQDNQEEISNISFINEIIVNIDVIHKLINKDLIRIFMDKFKFLSNLESINRYLLLGQGDMMQTLMELLSEELDKPSNLILKHNLESYLDSSIRASNAHFKDEENIKKLSIKLLNPSPACVGWDIFCLDYKVDLPLNIIFTSKLLKNYQSLFLFFWKIKRIEFSQINHIWKKLQNIDSYSTILMKDKKFIKKTMRISIHFNQEIIHFITNLHNYFALEVLETQLKQLKIDLNKVNNLDELILKHKQFVENIMEQCLLDIQNTTINKKIFSIFDIILNFRAAFDIFNSFLGELNYQNMEGDNSYIDHSRIKNTKEYLKKIIILYKEFQNQLIDLIDTIGILGKNNLKYLSMKLDYNYYYSNMEKEEEDKKNILALKKINEEKEKRKILLDQSDNDIIYTNNNIESNENEKNNDNYNYNNIHYNDDNNDNDNYNDNNDDHDYHYNDNDNDINIHYNDDNTDNDNDKGNNHDNGSDDDYNLMNKNNFNNLNNNYTNNELRDDDDINRNNNNEINADEDDDEIKFKNINYKKSIKINDEKDNFKSPDEDNKIEDIGDEIKHQNDFKINNYLKQAEPSTSQNVINKKPEKTYVFKSLRNNYKPSVINDDYNIKEKDKEKKIEKEDDEINKLIYRNKKLEDNIFDKNNNYMNSFSNSNNFDDDADMYIHNTDSVKDNYIFKSKNEPKTYQREERNMSSEGGNAYDYKNNDEVNINSNLDIDDEDRIVTDTKPKVYTMATRAQKRRGNK